MYGDIIIGANVKGDVRLEFVREQGNIVNNGSATVLYAKNFAVNTFSLYGKEYPIDFTIRANMYNNVLFKKDESTGRIHYNSTLLTTAQGIDVSSHQKTIDWAAVAGDNIDFAMIRLGFRGYGSSGSLNVDNYFKNNINGAKANGLDVGVYFFSQAINVDEAIAEANFVLKHLNGMSLDYPVVFDWESVSYTHLCGSLESLMVFKLYPLTLIVPSVGDISPVMSLIIVDFPEPDGPTRNANSPSSILTLIPFKAFVPFS